MNDMEQAFTGKADYQWVNEPDPTTGQAHARFTHGTETYDFTFGSFSGTRAFDHDGNYKWAAARWWDMSARPDNDYSRLDEFFWPFMSAVGEYAEIVRPEMLSLPLLPDEADPILKKAWELFLPDYLPVQPHHYVRKDMANFLVGRYKARFERWRKWWDDPQETQPE